MLHNKRLKGPTDINKILYHSERSLVSSFDITSYRGWWIQILHFLISLWIIDPWRLVIKQRIESTHWYREEFISSWEVPRLILWYHLYWEWCIQILHPFSLWVIDASNQIQKNYTKYSFLHWKVWRLEYSWVRIGSGLLSIKCYS